MATPTEAGIHILRITIAVKFPYSGHRHLAPFCIVKIQVVECRRTLIGVFHPIEFPLTVKRQIICRRLLVPTKCGLRTFISEVVCVTLETVDLINSKVMPFGERWSLHTWLIGCKRAAGQRQGGQGQDHNFFNVVVHDYLLS